MFKVAMSVLLSAWSLMASAGDLSAPKDVAQGVEKSSVVPASGATSKDLKTSGKLRNGAPQASKKPSVPLLLLEEKNFGLGCAQPS